jgi:hypothetical protein
MQPDKTAGYPQERTEQTIWNSLVDVPGLTLSPGLLRILPLREKPWKSLTITRVNTRLFVLGKVWRLLGSAEGRLGRGFSLGWVLPVPYGCHGGGFVLLFSLQLTSCWFAPKKKTKKKQQLIKPIRIYATHVNRRSLGGRIDSPLACVILSFPHDIVLHMTFLTPGTCRNHITPDTS